ncbi:MAG: hypothetical protein JSV88_22380 [Candidatus Aminicenantes bacterium]|nr:MAG: hypothetical protein JSV88_22380 [Candidatus Aminicenantes bacterium]
MAKPGVIQLQLAVLFFCISVLLGPLANADAGKQRNFMLVFDVKDYSAQIKEAVTYFFDHVFQKGDQLIIVSPHRLVGFSPEKLSAPKNQLVTNILKILKEDISKSMHMYRSTLEEMTQNVRALSGSGGTSAAGGAKGILNSYQQNRQILLTLRGNIEDRLMKYAKIFRRVKGENHLLMFLQKEVRPVPDRETMERLRQNPVQIGFQAVEVFMGEDYKTVLDFKKIETALKYARVRFHLLYLQPAELRSRRGVDFIENSGDIYSAFSNITKATDGIKLTTSNPSSFLKKIERLVEGKVEVEVIDQEMKEEGKK